MAGKTKQKFAKKILSILMLGVFVFSGPLALAQDDNTESSGTENEVLFEPVEKQIIQLTDEGIAEDWNISKFETYGLKFLVRGKEALTWSLNIEDGGFHNKAIEKSYTKVLTIVNSLFILGLLAIALMWIFSILIPRKTLKKVILVYGMAVIFINFALPINQLFIDGTNLLQQTLLTEKDGTIQITDIVQTPAYGEVLSYQNYGDESLINGKQGDPITLKLSGPDEETTSIGKIRVPNGETVDEEVISLNNKEISVLRSTPFSVYQEQVFFRFGLLVLTGIAYFIIALVFVLRIVILWALLILSPLLLFLAIFRSTRGWFLNWLSMYGRWLLIGPLTALGIAVIVNIWQLSGLPISVSDTYTPEIFAPEKISNIVFYLPGADTANTLSNTQEMMEYLIFLIMLYLPIFLGFTLTRRKVLHESLVAVTKKLMTSTTNTQQQLIQQVLASHEQEKEQNARPMGIMESIKHLVNDKISIITETTLPIQKLKVEPETPNIMMPTASNFLPENLNKTPIPKMLELLGRQKDSKASHRDTIEKMARAESITDKKEREKVMAVMNEIESRASNQKDSEAMAILHEVETIKEVDTRTAESASAKTGAASSISININDAKPEADRKVRDSSFDSKSEEKDKAGKQMEDKKKNEGKDKKSEEKPDKEPEHSNPEANAN
ncbi:type IV secretion system protein [Candidatus Peregrinibacteria bacterium]|nr:type IV secretion system protein [Candidatus Peregrinibacteria bacterium]